MFIIFTNYDSRQLFHKYHLDLNMSLKYPVPENYKVEQSKIRYQYFQSQKIQNKVHKYLNAHKNLNFLYILKSDAAIDGLDYFINVIEKWDEKSQEINGWTNCFLMIGTLRSILTGLKRKYGYLSKSIKFANVERIYQVSNAENKKVIPMNNLIFAIFIAIQEHQRHTDFVELQQILECIAQVQFLYLIPNYKSRGNRTYQLPWERIDDPIIEYRKKGFRKRENKIKTRKKVNPDPKQSKIKHFFVRVKSPSILDSEDDEILEIMDYLDNDK